MIKNYLNSSFIVKSMFFTFLSVQAVNAQNISTICGTGFYGSSGDGGPATAAAIWDAMGIFVTPGNDVFFTSTENKVRKISGTTGIITTIAGTGAMGYSGDNGPATAAKVNEPAQLCVDATGNVYIADAYNSRIRKVNSATGNIISYASAGYGMTGDGGPATAALMLTPSGIALDMSGNLYIADQGTNNIRVVNASTGIISSIAGIMTTTGGFSGDGGAAASASFNKPSYLCIDNLQNIYVADVMNYRIRKINTLGIISTIAGTGTSGFSGDGGPATAAMISTVNGIYADNTGNVYIADGTNARIRCINTATGIIKTVAGNGSIVYSGDGGPATTAGIGTVSAVGGDLMGRIYIGDIGGSHRIRRTGAIPNPALNAQFVPLFITSLYPNPSSGIFSVTFPDTFEHTIEIVDATGRSIKTVNCNSEMLSLDLTSEPNGIYFLRVDDNKSMHIQQLIIQH